MHGVVMETQQAEIESRVDAMVNDLVSMFRVMASKMLQEQLGATTYSRVIQSKSL